MKNKQLPKCGDIYILTDIAIVEESICLKFETEDFWDGTDNDGDGIGDTPYIIAESNQDNYPLMNQFIIPEFPSWIILPLFIIATLIIALVHFKKRKFKVG